MKLYVAPGACSMSCHIAFEEAKLKFEPVIGDWAAVARLNPLGAVPVLELDDAKVITQNVAILTYAADQAPQSGLLPKLGTIERVQAYQWLAWVTSELHPAFGPLFDEELPEADRKESIEEVQSLLAIADQHLNGKTFLTGNTFTAADSYLFVVYSWSSHTKVPVDKYRNLAAFAARVAERPAVLAVMKREGLL